MYRERTWIKPRYARNIETRASIKEGIPTAIPTTTDGSMDSVRDAMSRLSGFSVFESPIKDCLSKEHVCEEVERMQIYL